MQQAHSGATMAFDVVIVGGGSAGCVLAARLSENPDLQVALLEAGPSDDSVLVHCPAGVALMPRVTQLAHMMDSEPQTALQGRTLLQPRGRVLGGSSSVNAMIYLRGHPLDFDTWQRMGNPGWAWQDVLPWFIRAERNASLAGPWHGQDGPLHVTNLQQANPFSQRFVQAGVQAGLPHNPDFNGSTQEGVGLFQVTQHGGERCSAAKAYLTPARQRPNLHVLTDTTVDRIGLHEGRARTVHALRGQQTLTLTARREVVLCAGALQSPAVLMRSGLGPGAHLQALGIEVLHDMPGVGANLHDHPDVVLVAPVAQRQVRRDLFGLSLAGGWDVLRDVWQWRRSRTGRLSTNYAEAGAFFCSQPGLAQPDVQLHFVVAQLVDHGREVVPGHGFSLHVCALQPRSRGSVRLRDATPHSAPRIDPQFLSDPQDLQTLLRGVRRARQILAQSALARHGQEWARSAHAQSDEALQDWIRANTETVYHPVGTCRMGSDAQAVVDTQLRVHGVQGLRVVDASVMPRITSGNTNAPTIMLAERAAHWMR